MNWKDVGLFGFTHSGSTYLLNVFVELGLCIYRGEFKKFWGEKTDGSYEADPWQRVDLGVWFPRFQEAASFTFKCNIRVKWSHNFPSLGDYSRPIILMVRDPRDVLVSFSKRAAQGMEFHDFMLKPLSANDSGKFSLYPAYEWALYNFLVSCLADTELLCVVKFEDLRSNPAREIERILDFMKFKCSPSLIDQAIGRSSHQFVKAASEKWYALYPHLQKGSWRSMSRGRIGDWHEFFGTEEIGPLHDMPSYICETFGYKIAPKPVPDSGIHGDTMSPCILDALTRGFKAIECGNINEASRIFAETASSLSSMKGIEGSVFTVGKAATYCRWTEELVGRENFDSPLAYKTLKAFFSLDPFMVARPLILLAVARTFMTCGNKSLAMEYLEQAACEAKGHFYEMIEAGKTASLFQEKRRSVSILKEAAGYAANQYEYQELAALLMDRRDFIAAAFIMRRAGFTMLHFVANCLLPRLLSFLSISKRALYVA